MISFSNIRLQCSPLPKLFMFFHKLKSIPKSPKTTKPPSSFASMDLHSQLKHVFGFIDSNDDGKISSQELGELLACLGHENSTAVQEAEKVLKEVDRNGDGFIDLEEFLQVVASGNGESEDLMEAFQVFDADNNGYISAAEIRRVLVGLGEKKCSLKECSLMIQGVDKNGDGLVDFEEFRLMMMNSASSRN